MRRFLGILISTLCLVVSGVSLQAADYPDKPITLVAPYGAGGASDLVARALAETARSYLGNQPIVVINKPGNGGMTGARYVASSDPDGYTLLLARVGMVLYPAVHEKSPVAWDDYTFLDMLEATPMILCVNEKSPYQTIDGLINAIQQNPGKLTYAASGAMAIDGFAVQALLADFDLDPLTAATLVPYKGGGELATALLGGHVDFLAIAAGSLMPHIEAGKMRPLMIYAPARMEKLPSVPTATERGYTLAGQVVGWSALYGPKDLPENVVSSWQNALAKVATDPTWLELAERRGSISAIGTVDMTEYAAKQYQLYNSLAKKFGYLQ
jgi:tripartite-type tricarboxylate transporter receptor subunit TctC